MIRSLHVSTMRASDLDAGHEHHALFQASTIGALLEGRFDGDITVAELAERGDLGLGTLNGLDGELIVLDGRFMRADFDGQIDEVDPTCRSPFAVVVEFEPDFEVEVTEPIGMEGLSGILDPLLAAAGAASAVRVDGHFESVLLRSVPAQKKPYPTLVEVVDQQHVFELGPCEGTLVGFRFPDWTEGIEVAGYHLHFIDRARERGGHVLDFTMLRGTVMLESSSDLNVELPPGVELGGEGVAAEVHAAIEKAERP